GFDLFLFAKGEKFGGGALAGLEVCEHGGMPNHRVQLARREGLGMRVSCAISFTAPSRSSLAVSASRNVKGMASGVSGAAATYDDDRIEGVVGVVWRALVAEDR